MTREERDIIIKAQERIKSTINRYTSITLMYYSQLFDTEITEMSDYDKRFVDLLKQTVDELQQVLDNDPRRPTEEAIGNLIVQKARCSRIGEV